MKIIKRLRKHHGDLVSVFDELVRDVTGSKRPNLEVLKKDMSFIEGKLKVHLAMEDRYLYPGLTGHSDPEIRALTERYRNKMASAYDRFHAIVLKCREKEYFSEHYGEFVDEVRDFRKLLVKRIAMEDDVLFPLLEGYEGSDGQSRQ